MCLPLGLRLELSWLQTQESPTAGGPRNRLSKTRGSGSVPKLVPAMIRPGSSPQGLESTKSEASGFRGYHLPYRGAELLNPWKSVRAMFDLRRLCSSACQLGALVQQPAA